MANEATPLSVASDGNFIVWFVPTGNPLSVANLIAVTTKPITYSLTPGGFNRATTQEMVDDQRLTLVQYLQQIGRVKETLDIDYVYGDAGDVASAALTQGTSGWIVARYALPNGTAPAIAQKVDVIPIKCGIQQKSPPVANGLFTKKQMLAVTGPVQTDALLVA